MSRSFTIRDAFGRTWGSFKVAKEAHGKIHGFLRPTEDYSQVRGIFEEHEIAFSDPESDTDATISKIIELGAYLIDDQSGLEIDIGKVIFINDKLLVTCEVPR